MSPVSLACWGSEGSAGSSSKSPRHRPAKISPHLRSIRIIVAGVDTLQDNLAVLLDAGLDGFGSLSWSGVTEAQQHDEQEAQK